MNTRQQARRRAQEPRLGLTPLQARILRTICYRYTEFGIWPSAIDVSRDVAGAFGSIRHAATLLRKQGLLLHVHGQLRSWYQLTPEGYRMVTNRDPEAPFVCA